MIAMHQSGGILHRGTEDTKVGINLRVGVRVTVSASRPHP